MNRLSLVPISALALLVANCGGTDVSCTSQAAMDTIGKIAREQLGKDYATSVILDLQKTSFAIQDIRQREANKQQATCAANILISGSFINDKKGLRPEFVQRFSNTPIPIVYTIEAVAELEEHLRHCLGALTGPKPTGSPP